MACFSPPDNYSKYSTMSLWNDINAAINSVTGEHFATTDCQPISGGCINDVWKLEGLIGPDESANPKNYFVKCNQKSFIKMFEAEREALLEIASTKTITVPLPIVTGISGDRCWIVMEHLKMTASDASADQLGRQLAEMHKHTVPSFGWHRDNTIGSTPQLNHQSKSWSDFWRDQRLGYQLQTAANKGYTGKIQELGEQLMAQMEVLFENYYPQASLLHGDLWGGNWAVTSEGRPVLFDPATYYGDRETDIAMTELFGGFPQEFYSAYFEQWPLDEGYAVRKILYNLYHILNHLNLFGGSYQTQTESMMMSLLSEL